MIPQESFEDVNLTSVKKRKSGTGGMSQMLEHLCSKHDALSSNPTIQYHPKKKGNLILKDWKISSLAKTN
jgi:hypothetical protein